MPVARKAGLRRLLPLQYCKERDCCMRHRGFRTGVRAGDGGALRLQFGGAGGLKRPGSDAFTKRILVLSVFSLLIPLLSSGVFPDWTGDDLGMLVWLLALAPAFLLSYHHGWRGSSVALAAAMAAFSVGQAILAWQGTEGPSPQVVFAAVVVLLVVTLGSGWLSTAFHRSLEETMHLALTDRGTGLPNRGHAALHLERAFAASRRGAALSVVAFDLDHFKDLNDRFGHAVGDHVLAEFAGVLKGITRDMNLSARIGGEEFLSILDGVEPAGAEVFANRVLDELRGKEFRWGRVTASAGIAGYEGSMASPDVLVAAADQALYRAKRSGRDRVCVLRAHGHEDGGADSHALPKAGDPRRGRGELILVVDDDAAVLRVLTRGLERAGYAVVGAGDPKEALQIVRGLREKIDLVLTDVVMPNMNGFRFVEMLEEERPGVRVIYTSGYDDTDLDWRDVPGAVHGFLQKPVALGTMATLVREALDAPQESFTQTPAAAPALAAF